MAEPQEVPASARIAKGETKIYACTTCVQRKVKCDKRHPCLACARSGLQCTFRTTPPPQRRKRKLETVTEALLAKLRGHEATLRSAGLPFESFDDASQAWEDVDGSGGDAVDDSRGRSLPPVSIQTSITLSQTQLPHRRILVSEHGGMRYYEHGLIGALGQEYRQHPINFAHQHGFGDTIEAESHESRPEASEVLASSVLAGSPSTLAGSRYHHPSAGAIKKYWSIFLENVHPLTKIVHAPTMRQIMFNDTSLGSKNHDALKFSIYACVVATLSESECEESFGESQATLLYGYQSATRYALSEASFLRVPDIDLLRAHVFFLTSMLQSSEPSSLWVLMGSVIRIAQSQGLHRDGANLGLQPFETEMRRRLWWYIVTLDGRLTELMGSESALPNSTDTCLPSNLNDSDLRPDMTTIPPERVGASEMTFCLLRYEIARFMLEHDPRSDGTDLQLKDKAGKPAGVRSVSELENFLEEKFLRFCDPVSPVQFLTSTLARSTLCKLRQMEHRKVSRPNPEDERTTTLEQSNETLSIASRNIEYDNLIHSSRSLRGFLWHVHFHFPWGAPIVILKLLASHSQWNDQMRAAWAQIEELHEHHPEYREDDKVIHLVVGGLTIRAWATRQAAHESRGIPQQPMPAIVAALQSRQAAFKSRHNIAGAVGIRGANDEINFADINGFDPFELTDVTFDNADWNYWTDY